VPCIKYQQDVQRGRQDLQGQPAVQGR
jgi:hypothetical protein